MNTNLIVALIFLNATNWTSFQYEGAELGLIRSNHFARIEYSGKTNEFLLLSVDTGRHVWRTNQLTVPTPQPVSNILVVDAAVFDAMMASYETNNQPDVIHLGPGIFETTGGMTWNLAPEDSLIGSGMDLTTVAGKGVLGRYVIDGQDYWGKYPNTRAGDSSVADLTIACGGTNSAGSLSANGLALTRRGNVVVERVRVTGTGSFRKDVESFAFILSEVTNGIVRDCVVDENVNGYVSAFTLSGDDLTATNCTANFTHEPGWDTRLQAFCVAGNSHRLAYLNSRASNCVFAVFGDTGGSVNGLLLSDLTAVMLQPWGVMPIRLTGAVKYSNVVTNKCRWE